MSDDATTQDQSTEREAQTDDQSADTQQEELGEKGQAALKAERDARRKAERELKAINERLAEFENRDKSATEKAASERDAAVKRAEAAEQKIRTANGRIAVSEAVGTTASPRAVFALIRDDIEYDDDDQPVNIADLIAREKKADPTLFRAANGSGDGGATSSSAPKEYATATDRLSAGYANSSKAKR